MINSLKEKKKTTTAAVSEISQESVLLKDDSSQNLLIKDILANSKISKDRAQDNSVFRIIKSWEEGPTKQT